MKYITNIDKLLKQLIILAVIITALGLFFPITSTTFGPYYGSIAKNIAISNNWTDLILTNKDWLDKPHFPFWITAASFKIFGINSFAYMIPGFIFNLIGALYTYKLTNYLYNNKTTALLATLIYLTVLHLMLSAIDVRAEAYLLGQIMPAVYYWLQYDKKFSLKFLLLGAFFTGLALMTKGIFVIITIVSGVFCLWVYEKRLSNIISPKWWLALTLSLIFAIPELVALYIQFDLHPEKIIFGHTNVSGIKWFFIDSQFGRFFGTGYIYSSNPPPLHQLFFIHTYLWSFLPWSLVYPTAIYFFVKKFKQLADDEKRSFIFVMGNFWISFVMFSVTKFQVDHYTNIIFPFAAILSAAYLVKFIQSNHKILIIQQWLGLLIVGLLAIVIGVFFSGLSLVVLVTLELITVVMIIKMWGQTPFVKSIIIPVLAINLICVAYDIVANGIYHQYDVGYLATEVTNKSPQTPVVDYKLDSRALEFYAKNKYYLTESINTLQESKVFVVLNSKQLPELQEQYPKLQFVAEVQGNAPEIVIPNLISPSKLKNSLETYDIILINKQ